MTLHTIERFSDRPVREGEMITVATVEAANIIKDIRERITNTLGGRMKRYEELIQKAIDRGMKELDQKAKALGYDGVMAVRIVHPNVVDGGVEVVVYGTGFNYLDSPQS